MNDIVINALRDRVRAVSCRSGMFDRRAISPRYESGQQQCIDDSLSANDVRGGTVLVERQGSPVYAWAIHVCGSICSSASMQTRI